MATLLDLIQEWASLSEARTLARGVLSDSDNARWHELKSFYELLMAQQGFCAHPAGRYSAHEIRRTVGARARLRVHAEIDTIAVNSSDTHVVRISNVSCGGVLLLSGAQWGSDPALLLHIDSFSRRGDVPPVVSQVVWSADAGSEHGDFRYRLGVQFLELGPKESTMLDDRVVDGLETKLLSLLRDALSRDFIEREGLVLLGG